MRDLIEFIPSVLAEVGVPIFFQGYPSGYTPPSQYVTFLEYFSGSGLEAADKELSTVRLIQVNIWSKSNYSLLAQKIRSTLEASGFERTAEFDGPYTDGDSHFNRVLRFSFDDVYEDLY